VVATAPPHLEIGNGRAECARIVTSMQQSDPECGHSQRMKSLGPDCLTRRPPHAPRIVVEAAVTGRAAPSPGPAYVRPTASRAADQRVSASGHDLTLICLNWPPGNRHSAAMRTHAAAQRVSGDGTAYSLGRPRAAVVPKAGSAHEPHRTKPGLRSLSSLVAAAPVRPSSDRHRVVLDHRSNLGGMSC
jgi:hypothetical protein